MQCCDALDTFHGHKQGSLSLEQSHSMMLLWSECVKFFDSVAESKQLTTALTDFKTVFFPKMQQGFRDKYAKIQKDLVSLSQTMLLEGPPPSSEEWGKFKSNIEDLRRLATADIFFEEERTKMTQFAEAADIFHGVVFNRLLAAIYLGIHLIHVTEFAFKTKCAYFPESYLRVFTLRTRCL